MLPPGHIAAGYLAAKAASQFIPALNQPKFLLLTSFFAFFPDLDFFLAFFKAKKWISSENVNHRRFLTHAPLLYLLLFVIYYLLFPGQQLYGFAFLIGNWSHLILDSFLKQGIRWLYPFSAKLYGLNLDTKIIIPDQQFFKHWTGFLKKYTQTFSFKVEILLILMATLSLIYG